MEGKDGREGWEGRMGRGTRNREGGQRMKDDQELLLLQPPSLHLADDRRVVYTMAD